MTFYANSILQITAAAVALSKLDGRSDGAAAYQMVDIRLRKENVHHDSVEDDN